MTNILHLNTTKDWRGGDMQMLTTYQILQAQSDIQQIIFCPSDSKIAQQLDAQAIPYIAAREKHKLSFGFFKKVLQIAKSQNITIVHAHDSYALTIATVVGLFYRNLHIIYSRKRDNRISINALKKFKFNNKRLKKIICVSQAVKNVFNKLVQDDKKISVIYDGINVDYFASQINKQILHREFGLSQDTLIIGNIAALKPEKDLKTFIDAADLALQQTQRKLFFLVVGEGPLKSELISYAQEKGMANHIAFCGFRKDIAQILPEFFCLLMSSRSEGLPLTIFESFASKIPVVATAAGGIAEVLKHRQTGMISAIGDARALAGNLEALITSEELQERIKHNAYQLVNEKFSLSTMRENYYRLYKSLSAAESPGN